MRTLPKQDKLLKGMLRIVCGVGLLSAAVGCGGDTEADAAPAVANTATNIVTGPPKGMTVPTTATTVPRTVTTATASVPTTLTTAQTTVTTIPTTVITIPTTVTTTTTIAPSTAASVQPTVAAAPVDNADTAPQPTTSPVAASTPVEVQIPQPVAARVPAGQTWAPFASFAEVTLVHPSARVERIGFHESNNDGARQLEPRDTAVAPLVLESRGRGTGSRTAADIVVEPGTEIRAPVTGTVVRAGGYILYCDHRDDFAVIEPDAHPGWEVKILHIDGVMVAAGDRVEAGLTLLAPAATQLPFDSQVDEFTGQPSWPHVHIELVDPSIPDRPSSGGGC